MVIPDVNVFVNAFRIDAPKHTQARNWLEDAFAGPEKVGLIAPVLVGVVRVLTNPKIWRQPTVIEEAVELCEFLLNNGRLLEPTPQYWTTFHRLLVETKSSGNLVTDLSYAAFAMTYSARLATSDRDFLKFPGIDCELI